MWQSFVWLDDTDPSGRPPPPGSKVPPGPHLWWFLLALLVGYFFLRVYR